MSETPVKGLADLQRALDELPAKIEANIMRGALRAGAKVIMAEAKRLAPEGPPSSEGGKKYAARRGLLRDSIRISVRLRRGQVQARVIAGGKVKGGGAAFYAHMVERGTAAHIIKAPPGARLNIRGVFYTSVMHPGARKQPYMRPALETQAATAVQAVREYIRNRLASKHGITVPGPDDFDDPAEGAGTLL